MSTQSRRGGSRRKRSTDTQAAAATPVAATIEPAAADTNAVDVELLDDRTLAIAGGRRGFGIGRPFAGAIASTLLVAGLAFGAAMGPGGALGPSGDARTAANDAVAGNESKDEGDGTAEGDGTHEGDADGLKDEPYGGGDEPDATDKPEQPDATDKPDVDEPDATDKPRPEPTEKPAPDRTPKPTEKPEPPKEPTEPIALELWIKDGHPAAEWGSCEGLDFDYYKVVRSKDSTVTWPAGEGDETIGAVEQGGYRKAWDKGAPHGVKVWYRVFCVRKGEDGYKVVNASATRGIVVPEEQEPPDPIELGLEADVVEGKVVLNWSACEVDGFAFYKVVRSTSNDNPSYLPWTDGSDVIGVVEGMHDTELHVWPPDAGGTAWYRVQCIGYDGDHKVLLGQSAVVAVTTD